VRELLKPPKQEDQAAKRSRPSSASSPAHPLLHPSAEVATGNISGGDMLTRAMARQGTKQGRVPLSMEFKQHCQFVPQREA
jgi:hypothetical protein